MYNKVYNIAIKDTYLSKVLLRYDSKFLHIKLTIGTLSPSSSSSSNVYINKAFNSIHIIIVDNLYINSLIINFYVANIKTKASHIIMYLK